MLILLKFLPVFLHGVWGKTMLNTDFDPHILWIFVPQHYDTLVVLFICISPRSVSKLNIYIYFKKITIKQGTVLPSKVPCGELPEWKDICTRRYSVFTLVLSCFALHYVSAPKRQCWCGLSCWCVCARGHTSSADRCHCHSFSSTQSCQEMQRSVRLTFPPAGRWG